MTVKKNETPENMADQLIYGRRELDDIDEYHSLDFKMKKILLQLVNQSREIAKSEGRLKILYEDLIERSTNEELQTRREGISKIEENVIPVVDGGSITYNPLIIEGRKTYG